ncbi:MAG: glyoxalase [Robiginitomaculum sp.]|nr:MAG: glyoxalase [Robiginitomaculum sp.]
MKDKEETRRFYIDMFAVEIGREAEKWIDINFFGHQVSFHLKPEIFVDEPTNEVDGKSVPVRHFGVILDWDEWHNLSAHLKSQNVSFIIEPYIRFKGETGEQATLFFLDPSGNALEFKSFKDKNQIFAS